MNDDELDMLLSTAVGILMERFGLSPEAAADRLGEMARSTGVSACDVARLLLVEVQAGTRAQPGDLEPAHEAGPSHRG